MRKYHLQILCTLLLVIGAGLFLYKALILHYPLSPDTQTDAWLLEYHPSFSAKGKPLKLSMFIPKSTQQFLIMDESFISRGFGLTTTYKDGNRQAVWSIRNASGQQGLYYRAVVRRGNIGDTNEKIKPPELKLSGLEGADLEAAKSLVADIRAKSADTESFLSTLLKRLNETGSDTNISLLLGKHPTSLKQAQVAVQILSEAGIISRVVFGVILEDQSRNAPIIHRLEVYENRNWKSFDVITGDVSLLENFLPCWRGLDPIVQLTGGERLKTVVSVARHQEAAVLATVSGAQITSPAIVKFSLFSLPIETQSVYKVILMIPIGAFLVTLFRNLVGMRTFGTFMPVLIALAFRETQLLWGLVFFTVLIATGLTVRFYLEHLKLLLVPRLASILIVVILFMAMLSVLTHMIGIERGLSVALFPMVILTMTIERMSIMWDEVGSYESVKQGLNSLLVAALIYGVISNQIVGHLIFVFPELLLIILALTLMLGRYTGYRLLELKRFRALVD
ncbi:MAG: inactive transglutaminase family protein [bacterium]|nr:inactive transglutaminase family protein [bacterium]